MDGDREAGTLEVRPQGGYLRFRAACRAPGRELLRLAALGEKGAADLGTLIPREGLWRLDRRFSPAELRSMGLEKPGGFCLRRPRPEGWQPEASPDALFDDPLLRRLCRDVRGALRRREGERTLLALPLTDPFPLLPLFCLGTPRELEGRTCLVFSIFAGKPGMISPPEGQTIPGSPQNR